MRLRLLWTFLAIGITIVIPAADREYGRLFDASEGKALAQDLIAQWPQKDILLQGTLRIRGADGRRTNVPVKYTIRTGAEAWRGTYETAAIGDLPAQRLIIIRRPQQPNQYLFTPTVVATSVHEAKSLSGHGASIPFAGSEYWLSDLGLEFLHWPEQRLIKDAKITMRSTRPCKVLESVNPNPELGGYGRVVSWIDAENGAPIYVEAYDQARKPLKVFSLHKFRKINGAWQPTELKIQNQKTDAATILELQLEDDGNH
jgi:hypothetical protein